MFSWKIPPYHQYPQTPVRLKDGDEPFVDLALYSKGEIRVLSAYLQARRPGAISTAYLRRSAAEMLLSASKKLPEGYHFLVFDAWRPFSVQQSLFDEYHDLLKSDPKNAALDRDALIELTKKYVSFPQRGQRLSYVHSSGGAVDLTLLDPLGRQVDTGCAFDDFSSLARTDAFERQDADPRIRDHRRLLYSVMTEAGFTNYPEEWWHYDYGDLFWARATGKDALYSSYYDEKELPL